MCALLRTKIMQFCFNRIIFQNFFKNFYKWYLTLSYLSAGFLHHITNHVV